MTTGPARLAVACLEAITVGSIAENPFRSSPFCQLLLAPLQNGSHEKRTPGFLSEEKLQRLQVG